MNEDGGGVGFQLLEGAILCADCTRTAKFSTTAGHRHLSTPAHKIMQRFLSSKTDSITSIVYNESIGNEIDETLRLYFRYHFEHLKTLKSTQIFKSIS